MTDAIGRFLGVLRSVARVRSEKSSAIITRGRVPDEETLEVFARMSTPAETPPDEWISGHQVHVITTNTPQPAVKPKAEEKTTRAKEDGLKDLKKKRDRLLKEIKKLEGKRGKN